jgi:hypothetical protein
VAVPFARVVAETHERRRTALGADLIEAGFLFRLRRGLISHDFVAPLASPGAAQGQGATAT